MSVRRSEVERIAELAHLSFDDDELERFTTELNEILEYVESLRSLEASTVEEGVTSDPDVRSTRREGGAPDEVADVGGIAPRFEDGFFVVPPPPGVSAEDGAE